MVAVVVALVAGMTLVASPARAALRADADWYQMYFPAADGVTQLHADVLRPKGLAMDVKTPIILSVSPYMNHSGSTGFQTEQVGQDGPNPRFFDFLDQSNALKKGYTYVAVDLPGFGGSFGCNDWGGAREQAAVRAAVEWAAAQPWSTGKVGLLGKSYDGWTGLMGIAQQPKGLSAVVSLEPVFSGYRYIYMNGIRRTNWPYGTNFTQYDATPGRPNDDPMYNANGAPQAWCYPVNIAGHNADFSESGPYWAERNLLPTAAGKTTPLLLTQGFLETNTRWDGAAQYFNSLAGKQNRVWYGQFDHCRAWETQAACNASGTNQNLAVGRPGFVAEVMRFYDLHLKGIEPPAQDPAVEVQDIQGRWRSEESWPPADMRWHETELRPGTYNDSGSGSAATPSATTGIWSISKPLEHTAWLSGTPQISVGVDAAPNANLAVGLYDIDPQGRTFLISRGVQRLEGTGARTFSFTLYGQDWPIEAGHRVAVRLAPTDTGEFQYNGTQTQLPVTVRWAKVGLPFLRYDRNQFLEGGPTARLESYMSAAGKTVLTEAQMTAAEQPFNLPGPLERRP
jgi:predicted acyl esterase